MASDSKEHARRFRLEGLEKPARIRVDRWGIPHIRAETTRDLFFAQGFNAARDRLWQIDLWRKRGLGLLAADFGPGYLAQDKAARLFLYRGDMAAEWRSYAPDAQGIATAFVHGINAYIGAIEEGKAPLPREFLMLKTQPSHWQPEDVVRIRSHGITANAQSEIARAVLFSRDAEKADRLRQRRQPDIPIDNPAHLDLASIPAEIIDLLKLASAPVSFSRARLEARLEDAWRWSKIGDKGVIADDWPAGSNSWAIHGSRMASGRPLLASDPHRSLSNPSIRYLAHLSAPGIDVIGAGEPAVPGISIGHNERIAFGLTIFDADQEDVYVYETHGDDPFAYRYGEGFEAMRCVIERFAVKGAPTQEALLAFTRHGPVVFSDAARNLAIAMRSVWGETGAAPYLASLTTMRARDFAEFEAGLQRWKAPAVNKTYADVDGHIAWTPAGLVPRRVGWTGMLPVSGAGQFEWTGQLERNEMPRLFDPAEGFVVTANEFNLPADWDHANRPVGFEWTESSRALRIREVLSESLPHDLARSRQLQTDIRSLPALRLQRLIGGTQPTDDAGREACELLLRWDASVAGDSAAAALFEVWWHKHLRPAVIGAQGPVSETESALVGSGHTDSILAAIENDPPRFRPIIASTLAAAFKETRALLGPQPGKWRWGDLHQILFQHALSAVSEPDIALKLDVGPFALAGDASTPMHAGFRLEDWRISHGASVRLIMDVGNWDASLCINAPGQSGDPSSPHYADLASRWASGAYVPLLFSEAAIEPSTETVIELLPRV